MKREEILGIRPKFLTSEYQPSGVHFRELSYKYISEAVDGKDPIFESFPGRPGPNGTGVSIGRFKLACTQASAIWSQTVP